MQKRIDDIDTKYLLSIEWGSYAGRKARLGVLEVDNNSIASSFSVSTAGGNVDYSSDTSGVPVNGIEAIVIDSLAQTGRFRLVERTELGSVLGEQDLAASGRIAKPSGVATGNVLGAEYLVQVVITDYEANTSGKSGRVGLNVRLIDAEMSEIIFTKQIESVILETNLTVATKLWPRQSLRRSSFQTNGKSLGSPRNTPLAARRLAVNIREHT